jgi:hypothetical protein
MILLVLALAVLAVPVYLAARWIAIAVRAASHEAAVAAFLQFLPESLRDARDVTWASVACAFVAFALAWFALRTVARLIRFVAMLVIGVAGLLMLWNLFTLM